MALLNKPGVLMYHFALFILFGTLFLTLKNLNLEDVTETADYSNAIKMWIFGMIGAAIAFGFVITLASLFSKARKTGIAVTLLLIFLWLDLIIIALYTYFMDILTEELTDPGIRWVIISVGIVFYFLIVLGLLFYKFPGKIEESVIAAEVKKRLDAEEKKKKRSYCPVCKTPSEKSFKYCPGCGAKFSD
jgi:Na+-transporting methylmalonyl-CoA/oxaloacetate decarboxylase gamma subunit